MKAGMFVVYNISFSIQLSYISSAQAALVGFSNRYPSSSNLKRFIGFIDACGVLPPLKISQHVTPNAHCMERFTHRCTCISTDTTANIIDD